MARRLAAAMAVIGVALALAPRAGAVAATAGPACPAGATGFRVGAARADITPTTWPVAEAAYSIGRMAVGAADPFFARSLAIQSCPDGAVVVLTALDSQGYFTAYKEDPGAGAMGYGTEAIRLTVEAERGVPATHMVVAATHTHNSPDSIGIWGGSVTDNNKAPYLSLVKSQTVRSIEAAIDAMRPALISVGSADISALLGTYPQVSHDPADYPTDHILRVLQAVDAATCAPIATLVNAGVHADVAGPIQTSAGELVDPDWPGQVARNLEAALPGETSVVMAGAVGRTGPSFPSGTDPNSHDQVVELKAYGDVIYRRAATALSAAHPIHPGPVVVTDVSLSEEIAEPALVALFANETGTPALHGVMRAITPPAAVGTVLSSEVQTVRVGGLLLATAPGEAYPEVETELAKRIAAPDGVFAFGLANDQLGYTPPAFEYPVVALVDGGDEGFFTINAHHGDDIINQHLTAAAALGLVTQAPYDGTTAGPIIPPDQNNPPPQGNNPPEPSETPLSLSCAGVTGPPQGIPDRPGGIALLAAPLAFLLVVHWRRRWGQGRG